MFIAIEGLLDASEVAAIRLAAETAAFGDGAAWPVQGLIRNFRHVIEERIDAYSYRSDSDGAVPSIAAE